METDVYKQNLRLDCKANMHFLSGEELVKQNLQLQKNIVPVLSRGLKKTHPEDGDSDELQTLYDELHATLALERVERVSVRSQADYAPDNQPDVIRVTRKMGKWHLYGYMRNNVQYLHPHEALHLIEMNRLELYYKEVIVSLQQAFALMLGAKLSAEAYFVYSNLMRVGYLAEVHDDTKDSRPKTCTTFKEAMYEERIAAQCIWYCYDLLQAGRLDEAMRVEGDVLLRTTAASMATIADRIRNPKGETACNVLTDDVDEEEDGGWNVTRVDRKRRKRDEYFKSQKLAKDAYKEYRAEPFLDANLTDSSSELARFRKIFQDIQTIEISTVGARCDVNAMRNALPFDFDLFFATSSFRKSDPGLPDFRIIVRKSEDGPPSRRAILQTYQRQLFRARILVIFVSSSMSMQAYSYKFSK